MVLPGIYRGIAKKRTNAEATVDPLNQFVVTPDKDGMRFFDLKSGALIGLAEDYPSGFARITPKGNKLFPKAPPVESGICAAALEVHMRGPLSILRAQFAEKTLRFQYEQSQTSGIVHGSRPRALTQKPNL